MSENQFIKNYLKDFIELLQPNDGLINELVKVRNLLLDVSSNNKKIIKNLIIMRCNSWNYSIRKLNFQ